MRFLYALRVWNSSALSARFLKWGTAGADRSRVEGNLAEPLFDPVADEACRERCARSDPGSPQALRSPDRQRAPAHPRGGARARPPQGRGRRGGEEPADRVQPPARDVDHPPLHARRRAAARSDPGGQPRADPRGREVRLHARLQAFDVRHVVDPPGDLSARSPSRAARSACPSTSPTRCAASRGRAGRSARSSTATRRSTRSRSRRASRPRRSSSCSSSSRITSRSTPRSATARA